MAGWGQGAWNQPPWAPSTPFNPANPPTNTVGGSNPPNQGDNFNSLYNRLLARCPAIGNLLAMQFINDSWHQFQSRREWSFRRRGGVFAPPDLYNIGWASTNVSAGAPTLITGTNTNWDPTMIGRQIRIGGLLYPFYTVVGYQSPTAILIDQPWAGQDVSLQAYTILQLYYPVPPDFGWFYTLVSVKDGYRLLTHLTQAELALLDPQRTNFSQTFAAVFRDYTPIYGGVIGPVLAVSSANNMAPISTTTYGYTYPVDATYIIQVVTEGTTGTAAYQWLRAGQGAFTGPVTTSDQPQDLSDGVQLYWPDSQTYLLGSLYIINCRSLVAHSTPRYELWPGPTFARYLYPYIYIAKAYDLSVNTPWLPPYVANHGECLLEMALEKCAEWPGQDSLHPNIYHSLQKAAYHKGKWLDQLIDLERNDEEVGVSNLDYSTYPYFPSPWLDSGWQQTHSPFLIG